MEANGYIYFSRKTTETGAISSCNGAMAGSDLNFFFDDCDTALQQKLAEKDVTGVAKQECGSIPSRAIPVGFDIGFKNGKTVAINIFEL